MVGGTGGGGESPTRTEVDEKGVPDGGGALGCGRVGGALHGDHINAYAYM